MSIIDKAYLSQLNNAKIFDLGYGEHTVEIPIEGGGKVYFKINVLIKALRKEQATLSLEERQKSLTEIKRLIRESHTNDSLLHKIRSYIGNSRFGRDQKIKKLEAACQVNQPQTEAPPQGLMGYGNNTSDIDLCWPEQPKANIWLEYVPNDRPCSVQSNAILVAFIEQCTRTNKLPIIRVLLSKSTDPNKRYAPINNFSRESEQVHVRSCRLAVYAPSSLPNPKLSTFEEGSYNKAVFDELLKDIANWETRKAEHTTQFTGD